MFKKRKGKKKKNLRQETEVIDENADNDNQEEDAGKDSLGDYKAKILKKKQRRKPKDNDHPTSISKKSISTSLPIQTEEKTSSIRTKKDRLSEYGHLGLGIEQKSVPVSSNSETNDKDKIELNEEQFREVDSDEDALRRWEDAKISKVLKGSISTVRKPVLSSARGGKVQKPEDILESLTKRLTTMETTFALNERELSRLKTEQLEKEREKVELEKQILAAQVDYQNTQSFQTYVLALNSFIQTKGEKIEEIEESTIAGIAQMLKDIRKERLQRVADVLTRRGDMLLSRGDRGLFPVNEFVGNVTANETPGVDEFGRVIKYGVEANLDARLTTYESSLQQLTTSKFEGIDSTKASLNYAKIRGIHPRMYERVKESVLRDVEDTFNDVNEEFSSLPVVLKTFYKWKRGRSSDKQTFFSEFLPDLLTPYVRADVLKWITLQVGNIHLDIENGAIFPSCIHGIEEEVVKADLIRKVYLPTFNSIVSRVYDPLFVQQTQSVLSFLDWLIATSEASSIEILTGNNGTNSDSINMSKTLQALLETLRKAEAELILPCFRKCEDSVIKTLQVHQLEYVQMLIYSLEIIHRKIVSVITRVSEQNQLVATFKAFNDDVLAISMQLADKVSQYLRH